MTNDAFDEIERMFGLLSDQFGTGSRNVATDVIDEGDAFVVSADLPGYVADDIDVSMLDPRTLHVIAETERERTGDRYVKRERRRETVDRRIALPDPVDVADASASYDNGVLRVRLEKRTTDDEDGTDIPVK